MPGLQHIPRDVRTVHLGEYSWQHADLIAEQLETHGIVVVKEPGLLVASGGSGSSCSSTAPGSTKRASWPTPSSAMALS